MRQQMIDLGFEMGAGDDGQARTGLARLLHDLAGLKGFGDGDEQDPGRAQIGGGQHIIAGGIAPDMLDIGIGLGYVPADMAAPGTELTIDVRGRPRKARTVPKPIYKREEP